MNVIGDNAKKTLKSYIERIERLEGEKADIATDIKEVYAEAKGNGFDTKAMRKIVARRKIEKDALAEEDAMLELYEDAINSIESLLE